MCTGMIFYSRHLAFLMLRYKYMYPASLYAPTSLPLSPALHSLPPNPPSPHHTLPPSLSLLFLSLPFPFCFVFIPSFPVFLPLETLSPILLPLSLILSLPLLTIFVLTLSSPHAILLLPLPSASFPLSLSWYSLCPPTFSPLPPPPPRSIMSIQELFVLSPC